MTKQLTLSIALVLSITWIFGQDATPIKLVNPSFEGLAQIGTEAPRGPRGWVDCGFRGETAPDIHPVPGSPFQVTKPPYDGSTYLGMVVRDNDTWEAISQYLRQPLKADQCYRFRIHIAKSPMYVSISKKTGEGANYTTPTTLRVWGGDKPCGKIQLLHTTKAIINTRWIEYEMEFRPKRDYQYIVFEAFYRTPVLFPYNGNVIVDNATDIVPIPCDESEVPDVFADEEVEGGEDLIAINEPIPTPTPTPQTPKTPEVKTTTPTPNPRVEEKPEPEPSPRPKVQPEPKETETNESGLATLDTRSLREGSIIRVKKLYFAADKSNVRSDSRGVLDEIYRFLKKNERVIVEIGGHTNGTPAHVYCDSLSTMRAQTVASYLVEKGIPEERVKYKGYGKRKPIASNRTAEGRRRNQRVEIKVLGFKG